MKRKVGMVLVLLLMIAGNLYATETRTNIMYLFNTSSKYFPESARIEGLGRCFAAIADDPNAVKYNPAGLTQIESRQMLINYNSVPRELLYIFAKKNYGWGFVYGNNEDLSLISIETRTYTETSSYYEYNNIGFVPTRIQNIYATFSFAWPIQKLSIGLDLRVGVDCIEFFSDTDTTTNFLSSTTEYDVSFGAGLGFLYDLDRLKIGFYAPSLYNTHFGSGGLGFYDPRLGVSYRFGDNTNKFLCSLEIPLGRWYNLDFEGDCGLEYSYKDKLLLRAGFALWTWYPYFFFRSFGAGYHWDNWGIDYACANYSHKISILYKLNIK